jgi:hypothetical protein
MKRTVLSASALISFLTSAAGAANIYLLSSGDTVTDDAAVAALTSRGHTVTVGVQYNAFDGTINLAGFQTVYLQCNFNWTGGVMPVAGQQQLVDWVNAGGRLVTSEWATYYSYASGGKFEHMASIFPGEQNFSYGSVPSATYTQAVADPVINAGLPTELTFALTSYAGTEVYAVAKSGATTYYQANNSPGAAGLVGWTVGSGSVFSFMSTCGPDQVADSRFGLLFSNVMGAGGTPPCYPNCDGVGGLTANDFSCFLNAYVAAESYANCDGVGGLTANDFSCFLNSYVAGCS